MWFFLVKSIVGAIVGQSTNTWFKKNQDGDMVLQEGRYLL